MEAAAFETPAQVRAQFPTVSLLGDDVTVFDIDGNEYRLRVSIRCRARRIYIRRAMTHAEYDQRTRDGAL